MSFGIFDIAGHDIVLGAIPVKDALVSATLAATGAAFATEAGADGSVVRYATHERRAVLTIVLKRTSKENAKLSALHGLDVAAPNGAGVVSLIIRNNGGTTLVATDKAWIQQMAELGIGNPPPDTTWLIECVLDSPLNWVVGS